ncbi:hypothetical protein Cgig2_025790 [Carnegiea gigantea]|uniref:Uncharacterized protein n=1 Tax=Carnegiea gigantea TaxID=171969 RepID=A0A9Q1GU65_9CARY|nr:hypothetical protein Cgig2_025790 [Carnegiea gigantea]
MLKHITVCYCVVTTSTLIRKYACCTSFATNIIFDNFNVLRYSPLNIYIDESGNVTKKKDFKSKDIHKLRDGERVLISFNSAGKPIRDPRSALSRWMVSLMKDPNLCPRDAKDFKKVKENYGAETLRNLWKYSQNGKATRALNSHTHTAGTKSLAQYRAEFNDAKARMESHRASALYSSEVKIDKEVWTYFMGDDKPRQAQLFGMGVTKSQVKHLRDGSLITRNDGEIVIDNATTTKLHHL